MRRNPETEDGGVDRDRVTVDRTSIFELANALGRTGAGQANLSREFSNGHTAVLRQRSDDRPIGRIEGAEQVAASIHRPPSSRDALFATAPSLRLVCPIEMRFWIGSEAIQRGLGPKFPSSQACRRRHLPLA